MAYNAAGRPRNQQLGDSLVINSTDDFNSSFAIGGDWYYGYDAAIS